MSAIKHFPPPPGVKSPPLSFDAICDRLVKRRTLFEAALSEAALSDAAVLSRARLSAGLCESSARRGAVSRGAVSWGRLSLLAAALLLSTSAAKLEGSCEGSGRAGFGGALGYVALALTSDLTLTT